MSREPPRTRSREGLAAALLLATLLPALAPAAGAEAVSVPLEGTLFSDITLGTGVTADPAHGYLWFGTEGGLVRTAPDLTGLTLLTSYHGLPDSHVVATRLWRGDTLVIATATGVALLDIPTMTVRPLPLEVQVPTYGPEHLDVGGDHVWVATLYGLVHYDLANNTAEEFTRYNSPLILDPTSGVAAHPEGVYVATGRGVFAYNLTTKAWSVWNDRDGLPTDRIRHVALTPTRVWAGTDVGAAWIDRATGTVEEVTPTRHGAPTNRIHAIETRGEEVWFGTDHGILVHDPVAGTWKRTGSREGLSSDWVKGLALYDDTRVAVSTIGGLNVLDLPTVTYRAVTGGNMPRGNAILNALPLDGSILFGTGSGLATWTPATGRWTSTLQTEEGLAGSAVYGLAADPERLWVASNGGLQYQWRANGTWGTVLLGSVPQQEVAVTVSLDEHEVWAGQPFLGVVRYNRTLDHWTGYDPTKGYPGDPETNAILVDFHYVWVATETGLVRFDRRTETWAPYPVPGNPTIRTGRIIANDTHVLIATPERGILAWERDTDTLSVWNATNGLAPFDEVRALAFDGADLWVGGIARGAARRDGATGNWTVFTTADGLGANFVNAIVPHGDHVYLGTLAGISRYSKTASLFEPPQAGPHALVERLAPVAVGGDGQTRPEANPDGTPFRGIPVVTIDTPSEGDETKGDTLVTGTTRIPNGTDPASVTIHLRLDSGPWTLVGSGATWNVTIPASALAPGPHLLTAMASVDGSAPALMERRFRALAPDETPGLIGITFTPPGEAGDGEPVPLTATLSRAATEAYLLYTEDPTLAPLRKPLTIQGRTVTGTLPAPAPGETLHYALLVRGTSGMGRSPATGYHPLTRADDGAFRIEGIPAAPVETPAGEATPIPLRLHNPGPAALAVTFDVKGVPAEWIVTPPPTPIPPGAPVPVTLAVAPPSGATAGERTLAVKALGEDGAVLAISELRITVPAAENETPAPDATAEGSGIPGPALPATLAAIALALLAARRARQ